MNVLSSLLVDVSKVVLELPLVVLAAGLLGIQLRRVVLGLKAVLTTILIIKVSLAHLCEKRYVSHWYMHP